METIIQQIGIELIGKLVKNIKKVNLDLAANRKNISPVVDIIHHQ